PEVPPAAPRLEVRALAVEEAGRVVLRAEVHGVVLLEERAGRLQIAVFDDGRSGELVGASVVSEVVDLELARLEVEVDAADPVLAPVLVNVRLRPEADVAGVQCRAVGDRPIGTVRERRRDDLTAGRVLAAGRPPSPVDRADVRVVEAARAGRGLEAPALER